MEHKKSEANNRPVIRPDIMKFAEQMEAVMSMHDMKKGDSWKECPLYFLQGKLREEFLEYSKENDYHELLDIANLCMMLWNREVVYVKKR